MFYEHRWYYSALARQICFYDKKYSLPDCVVREIVSEFKEFKPNIKDRYIPQTLHFILSNLYARYREVFWTGSLSLNKTGANYREGSIYTEMYDLTTTRIGHVFDFLLDKKYIFHQKGRPSYTYENQKGENVKVKVQSGKVQASHALIFKIDRILRKNNQYEQVCNNVFSIDLRRFAPILTKIEFEKDKFVTRVAPNKQKLGRPEMVRYLKLLLKTDIAVGFPDRLLSDIDKLCHRYFAGEDCNENGRLYGELWKRIKSELRHYITINGNSTVEHDFSAMHPRILYALECVDLTDDSSTIRDPYYIKELDTLILDDKDKKLCRWVLKKTLLIALNAKRKSKAMWGIRNAYADEIFINEDEAERFEYAFRRMQYLIRDSIANEKGEDAIPRKLKSDLGFCSYLLDALRQANPQIGKYFYSQAYRFLFRIESDICIAVIDHFTKKGIPVLSVHDSFVVEEQYGDELAEVMRDCMENGIRSFNSKPHDLNVSGYQSFTFKNKLQLTDIKEKPATELKDEFILAELHRVKLNGSGIWYPKRKINAWELDDEDFVDDRLCA